MKGSFQETAPSKTTEHTVKHRDGGVGSVVANHRGGSESSMVVTTLFSINIMFDTATSHISQCIFKTVTVSRKI